MATLAASSLSGSLSGGPSGLLGLFGPLSATELLVLLLIVVLLFGARRIPEVARGLGEGIRNFRSSLRGDDEAPGAPGGSGASGEDEAGKPTK